MKKHIHVNSSIGGFEVSTKRIHTGKINGKDIYTEFLVVSDVCHLIRNSVMNGILYTSDAFDDLANRLMASNERIPAPLSHPSDEQGRFISAKDPLIMSSHSVCSFDTDWAVKGDRLISNTYVNLRKVAENGNADWLIERLNNKQPIDRSTGLELIVSETSGVGPDGERYSVMVEKIVDLDHSAILNPETEPGAKNNSESVGMFTNGLTEVCVDEIELYVNASSPNLSLPIAPQNQPWDEVAAINRIREYSGSSKAPSSHYRKFFMSFDQSNTGDFNAYKMPFSDIIDGLPYAIPAALSAINTEGMPEQERNRISANIEHYKSKAGRGVNNSILARFLNFVSNKFGLNLESEYNTYVSSNNSENEVDPMKDKILAALNAAGVKTEGLDDDALFAAYNEAMNPKAGDKKKDDDDEDKPKEKADAANSKLLEAINALAAEVKEIKTASNASAKAEIDALAAQVANANILPLDDAKKLSKDALNGLLAKSGVVVANGAGGYVAAPQFEQLPE